MVHKIFLFIAAFSLLSLSACTQTAPAGRVAEMTFDHVEPLRLSVRHVDVSMTYRPPMTTPHVEHLFDPPPYVAVRHLLQEKLVSSRESRNALRVKILDASVREEKLPVKQKTFGFFSKDPAIRYDGRIALSFEVFDPLAPEVVLANANVTASRTKTVEGGAAPSVREKAWFEMTEKMLSDLRDTMQETLAPLISSSQGRP